MMFSYEIKKKIEDVRFYGSIMIDVEQTNIVNLQIEIRDFIPPNWNSAIKFGAEYYYEHFRKEYYKGLKIDILDLDTLAVDTSNIIVVYLVVNCLGKALGVSTGLIELEEKGVFQMIK